MKLRSIAALGVTVLVGQTALAQPAPTAPPPQPAPTFAPAPPPTGLAPAPAPTVAPTSSQRPQAAPAPTVPPPANWGSGIAPPPSAQPAPTVMPSPYPMPPQGQPGAYPPPGYGYPPGGYPGWGSSSDEGPTAIGPDGRPRLLPLEMKYDPDKGVPPGYRLAEKRRSGLAIAGASIFGGLWIASAIAGGIMEDSGRWSGTHGWPMYIPVIGPFITIESYNASAGGATPLVFDGIGQAAGLVMFIIGLGTKEKVLKYQFDTPAAQVELTPVASPLREGGFAGVTGTF